ncbi:MAG: hypothetical protein II653_06315 [Lachnospiraceae bacterium]|nr:hypothetical protein [Lachnospiraceae bacterium]
MKCHNCGKEIPDGALACFACNANVPSNKLKNKKSQGKTSSAKQIQPRQANSQRGQQSKRPTEQQSRRPANQQTKRSTNQQSKRPINQQSKRPINQQPKRPINQQSKRPTKQQLEIMEAADNRKKAITIGVIATIVLLIALGIFVYYFVNYSSYSIDGSYAAIEDSSRCIIKIKNNKGTLRIYENDELVRNEDITIQKQDNTTFTINKNNNQLLLYDADTNTLTLKENGEIVYVLEQLNN